MARPGGKLNKTLRDLRSLTPQGTRPETLMLRLCGGLLLVVTLSALAAAAAPAANDREQPATSAHAPSPSHERLRLWELSFPDDISLDEYARQLDFFQIEIAAVSKNNKVEYISHVSNRKPEKHVGWREKDPRLNIPWKSGTLHAVDRKLLLRAGISSRDKELTHYFPLETKNLMLQVERGYAKRDPSELRRMRFEIRATKSGEYEFVVVEQDPPRKAPAAGATASPSQNQPAAR